MNNYCMIQNSKTFAFSAENPTGVRAGGSGGLTLANHLGVPFTQEVVAVATSLQESSRLDEAWCSHRPGNHLRVHRLDSLRKMQTF